MPIDMYTLALRTPKTICMPVFRDLQLVVPPTEERKIADIAVATEARFDAERLKVPALANVKSALMSALLIGDVFVIPCETAA